MSNFDEKVEFMRNMAERLVPYNFPLGSVDFEYYIAPLKRCEAEVDGYTVVFHLNKAMYGDHHLETFQVHNKYAPFLPFQLVAKLARRVLGGHHLSLVEFYQGENKIYCWSVCLNERGCPITSPLNERFEERNFEGFSYRYIKPEQLNLY